jgi:hypothetical protein
MKKLFTLFFVLSSAYIFAAPGDDCTTAITVSSSGCSAAGAYNNTGTTGTLTPPACFTTGTNNGMWFSFVASSVNVSVSVIGGTLTAPQIALLAPPAGGCTSTATFTVLSCSSPTGTDTATVVSNGGLTIGNTYFIYVDGQNSTTGTFQVCLSSPQPPTNDDPCAAITPPSITNWCSPNGAYTTLGSSPTTIPFSCLGAATPNTVWFKFTPTQIGVSITINGGTGGITPAVDIVTLTGGCAGTTYTPVGCAAAAAGQTAVTLTYNFLVPGTTYYIGVAGESGDGEFSICINNYAITSTVPNDQCTGAISLCPGERYYGTTAGATATNDIPIQDWQCNGDLDNAVWYSFVATTPPQTVIFNVNWTDRLGTGYMQFEVFKYTGTGSPCAHDNNAADWQSMLTNVAQLPCDEATSGPGTETVPATQFMS